MERSLLYVMQHLHEFKFCRCCNTINFCDNGSCHSCGCDDFDYDMEDRVADEAETAAHLHNEEPQNYYITVR